MTLVDRGHVDFAIAPPTHKGALEGLPDTMLQAQSNQFSVVRPKLGGHERRELDVPPQPRWAGHSLVWRGLQELSSCQMGLSWGC